MWKCQDSEEPRGERGGRDRHRGAWLGSCGWGSRSQGRSGSTGSECCGAGTWEDPGDVRGGWGRGTGPSGQNWVRGLGSLVCRMFGSERVGSGWVRK